jgi:hypothetical protein
MVALELFANSPDGLDGRDGYIRYMKWRDECSRLSDGEIKPSRPPTFFGDTYYVKCFNARDVGAKMPSPETDLRDVVLRSIKEIDPSLRVEDLRMGWRTRPMVAIRATVITNAIRAHHRVADIARFLNMSDTAVSRVAALTIPRPPVRFDKRSWQ